MKIVKLPRSYTVTASGNVGDVTQVDLAFVENTKKIILAVSHIETELERQILEVLFPKLGKSRNFFESSILMTSFFTMSEKRRVFLDILKSFQNVSPPERTEMERLLARAIRYRNAFTHGRISYGVEYRATLHYFEGGPKAVEITDEYLTTLQDDLMRCTEMINALMVKAGFYIVENNGLQRYAVPREPE